MLKGKKFIIGVCGSIAAYKSSILVRLLIKQGAEVKVIATPAALQFVTPVTLATLSKHPVLSDFIKNESGEWHNHVDLGLWADGLIIAPGSANTMAKMSHGLCDNLLTAVYLSARCPVFIAPAMDLDMYQHPTTQENLQRLSGFGNHIIPAEHGELASGLVGMGRMAEPEHIVAYLDDYYSAPDRSFRGKNFLITAGPTYEAIDPVRFVGNHSSGRMGYALAREAANLGANVTLVSGPSALNAEKDVNTIKVQSADEMHQTCVELYPQSDIAIFAAAVADYKPSHPATQKIKKKGGHMQLDMEKTRDIASELGKLKTGDKFHVGFALETENEKVNALEKLEKKNFDLIVLNSLNDEGAGFGHETNKVTIFDKENNAHQFGTKSKSEVAKDILKTIKAYYHV